MYRLGCLLVFVALTATTVWAGPAPIRNNEGDTITPKADISVSTAATLIAASNATRAVLNCSTDATIRWGSSAVTSAQGQRVLANSSVAITNTGAVYMAAESGSAVVSCTEETFAASSGTGVFSP